MNSNNLKTNFIKNGIISLNSFLKNDDIKMLKKIVTNHCKEKNVSGNTFPINFVQNLKIFKKPKKILSSLKLLNLLNKYQLKELAENLTNSPMELVMIDGYISYKSDSPVLDWHLDQAYSGKKEINNFVDPDESIIKFFFYLTSVELNNGCLGYIPGSNKIAYCLKKLIQNKEIEYAPYWSLEDFRNLIKKENIKSKIEKLIDKELINEFFKNTQFIDDESIDENKFFFPVPEGSLLVFDEAGAHKGSSPRITDRYVLRFFFKKLNKK